MKKVKAYVLNGSGPKWARTVVIDSDIVKRAESGKIPAELKARQVYMSVKALCDADEMLICMTSSLAGHKSYVKGERYFCNVKYLSKKDAATQAEVKELLSDIREAVFVDGRCQETEVEEINRTDAATQAKVKELLSNRMNR